MYVCYEINKTLKFFECIGIFFIEYPKSIESMLIITI